MNMIDAPNLLTIIFVLVDDWYQQHGHKLIPPMPGPRVLTLREKIQKIVLQNLRRIKGLVKERVQNAPKSFSSLF